MRVPQELGTPHRFHLSNYWSSSGLPDPKTPGLKSASDLTERRTQAQGVVTAA